MNVTDDWKNKEFYYFVGIDVRFATLKIKLTQAGINLFFQKKKRERERQGETERDRERLFFEATFYTKRVWYSHVLNVNLSQVLQKKSWKFWIFRSKLGYWTNFEIGHLH